MTRPLRRLHFWIWLALAIVLPTLMALGVATRGPLPENNPHWKVSPQP